MLGMTEKARFYQASTSELYGKVLEMPQSETTPFYPRSPYAAAKLYAYWIAVNYREAYNMFASNGILSNHERPVRGETFVTRKITRAGVAIELGLQQKLYLGNLDAKRDLGHAKDYVEDRWRILQHEIADDWVLATGEMHSVREFVELALAQLVRSIEWRGEGLEEQGVDARSGDVLVAIDPNYFRPRKVDLLLGDPAKAHWDIGWKHQTSFAELVEPMVLHDMNAVKKDRRGNRGYESFQYLIPWIYGSAGA